MRSVLSGMVVLCSIVFGSALGQTAAKPLPAAVLSAKTIAVVNDTRDSQVTKGAEAALQSWGQFKVVDDPQLADVTLRFEKTRSHEGQSTQKTDDNGKPTDYGYSMSFGSSITMKAYVKDADAAVFSTKTEDSKTKAGMSCVNDFHTAYRTARQQQTPQEQSPK